VGNTTVTLKEDCSAARSLVCLHPVVQENVRLVDTERYLYCSVSKDLIPPVLRAWTVNRLSGHRIDAVSAAAVLTN
jgi:hypothetical protein